MKTHWNNRYKKTEQEKLGWYESKSQLSLHLIDGCHIPKDSLIVDIGSGSSVLIDNLIENGYTNLIATDISEEGLAITRNRLGENAKYVRFIDDDLTQPTTLNQLHDVTVWHDRAVLHFFTQEKDRQSYRGILMSVLKPGGFAIISTFAINGLTRCSGLDIQQYSAETLSSFLGNEFQLLHAQPYNYTTTWGQERPFLYCVFQKKDT